MILYQLSCSDGHEFEAWFRDGAAYDSQSASGDVACPFCGDTHVSKAPMAPRLATRKGKEPARSPEPEKENPESRARKVAEQILRAVNRFRTQVEENCDYVGDNFAEEARKIHYGETEKRGIYGEATDQEKSDLDDEDIEYHKIPFPIRRNDG